VSVRHWREWFVSPEEETPTHQTEDEIRVVSGAGHQNDNKPLKLQKKLPPRCASCKKFVGFDTGMHLMISGEWRIHISCFTDVLERHYENGEVIDLTTGQICKVEDN
jgi:hypothetical protein